MMNAALKNVAIVFSFVGVVFPALAYIETSVRGKRLYEEACTACHSLRPVEMTRDGRAGWEDTVHKMVVAGAQLNSQEMEHVIDYLASRFGPGNDPMITGPLPPNSPLANGKTIASEDVELPDGQGKELVNGYCVMCHDLGRVVAAYREKSDWERYATNMLAQGGIKLPEHESKLIVDYLTKHFGY